MLPDQTVIVLQRNGKVRLFDSVSTNVSEYNEFPTRQAATFWMKPTESIESEDLHGPLDYEQRKWGSDGNIKYIHRSGDNVLVASSYSIYWYKGYDAPIHGAVALNVAAARRLGNLGRLPEELRDLTREHLERKLKPWPPAKYDEEEKPAEDALYPRLAKLKF